MANKKPQQNSQNKPQKAPQEHGQPPVFSPRFIAMLADEVAKTVVNRLPGVPHRPQQPKKARSIENAVFLDTSAIIDGRIFDVINMGLLSGTIVIPESILLELKHIADSQDMVKRERGRKGLYLLDKLKKSRGVKVLHLPDRNGNGAPREVDEKLIDIAKANRGKIITCDYNLEKKASISGVLAINVHTLANYLKIKSVPGESLHIKILHQGKDVTQGVGYLDDGTMLVVEHANGDIGREIDVIVSRVIQTTAGRILFAKKI
jgi:uncharacterized protein YacL